MANHNYGNDGFTSNDESWDLPDPGRVNGYDAGTSESYGASPTYSYGAPNAGSDGAPPWEATNSGGFMATGGIDDGSGSTVKSKGWFWTIVGALIMLVVLAFAALFYIIKVDKEVNGGGATAAGKSTSTVTKTVKTSTSTVTETATEESKKTATKRASESKTAESSSASSGFISSVSTSRGTVSTSHPACDGRTILIVQSVLGGNNSTTRNELATALGKDGALEFAPPGQCSSLRGSYNGSDVYPVYFDMGSDQQAACTAKSSWGGNVRTLNNEGDFSDPC